MNSVKRNYKRTCCIGLAFMGITAFVSYIPLGAVMGRIGRKKVIAIGFVMMPIFEEVEQNHQNR